MFHGLRRYCEQLSLPTSDSLLGCIPSSLSMIEDMSQLLPSKEGDWSRLPSDLLEMIAAKLPDVVDHVRFRAFCLGWRAAVSLSTLLARLPWLLPPPSNFEGESFDFYSLSDNRIHSINLPSLRGKELFGSSSRGWIAAFDSDSLVYLLNPLIGAQIQLPPLTQIICHDDLISFEGHVANPSSDIYDIHPPLVVFCCSNYAKIFLYRMGDKSWTKINPNLRIQMDTFVCHKEKIVLLDSKMNMTLIIDASTPSQLVLAPFTQGQEYAYRHTLVESSEELLMVTCHKNNNFQVFRLDHQMGSPEWIKVWKLENMIIFLDAWHGLSFKAGEGTGLKGNCIYFFDDWGSGRFCIRVFDMEDDTVKELPTSWGGEHKVYVRHIWFLPSLI